jgi:cellulose synthase/poly-beta-1,6-N-acetylglucosamine synthase-like glycosyltransferase
MLFLLNVAGLIVTVLYGLFIFSLISGLRRLQPGTSQKKPFISVVVAVRNEEQTIELCVSALLNQNYPSDKYEIIIVNDRSEDATGSILKHLQQFHPQLKVIDIYSIPDSYSSKKYALSQGIHSAQGEIILTTDADCVPPTTWVSEMVTYFDDTTGFIAGFSPHYHKRYQRGIISSFLYMDSLGLAAASAGGIGRGTAWTCAGRNLAYRKSAFEEVGGFESVKHIISGDDDLLMFLIQRKTKWKLRFAIGQNAVVPTYSDLTVKGFIHQRMRHSSKFFVHPPLVKASALAIVLFYSAFLLYPVYMLSTFQWVWSYLFIAGSKYVIENITLKRAANLFGASFHLNQFLPAFILHPLVIVIFGILGSAGKTKWK